MGKGSGRRPGQTGAYEAGWDRIFAKKACGTCGKAPGTNFSRCPECCAEMAAELRAAFEASQEMANRQF